MVLRSSRLWMICALLAGNAAGATEPRLFSVVPEQSALTYVIVHKLHKVEGTAKPRGKARVTAEGTVQAQIAANMVDFDSGIANRDTHMKESVEAEKFPTVELKATGTGLEIPKTFPGSSTVTLEGQLTLHGITQPVKVPVTAAFTDASHATATAHFEISLDSFKVDRPSLLFVKIEDVAEIVVRLQLEAK